MNPTNVILKYVLYFFPIFIIIGNAAINSSIIIVSLLYFFNCLLEKKILFLETKEFKFFLYLYLYLLLNSLLSEDIKSSLIRIVPYFKFFIFVLVYRNFIETKKIDLKKLGLIWFLIIIGLSIDIIYQSIFGHNLLNYTSPSEVRNSGLFMDELVAGGFLLAFVFIIYNLTIKNNNNLKLILFFTFFIIVIFLTGERSNFLKYIFILIGVYYFISKINFLNKILSLFTLISVIILLMNSFGDFKNRYFSSISFSSSKNLNYINSYLTSEYGSHTISAFYMFKDNLFFGVGNKNFRKECSKYSDKVIQFQKKIDSKNNNGNYASGCANHPHQIYNELLSEHGLIGSFIIFFLFYQLIFKDYCKKRRSKLNLVCLLYLLTYFIPILPSGSFFSTLTSTFFWINYLFYIVTIKNR